MSLIGAGTIVLDGQVCRPGWLEAAGGRIAACGPGAPPWRPDVDVPDGVVVPGFVDMHVHGGGGASYDGPASDVAAAAAFHRRHGSTTTLASLVTASPAQLLERVRLLADLTSRGVVAGIHLEGPWLAAPRCGAHDRRQLRDADPAEIDALLAAGDGAIRMVTLAPELPGSRAAIARFLDAAVAVAIGHTDATYEQTRQAISLGASVGTHLFNAMRPLSQREPGPALALLADPRVTVELIADGVHIHPALVDHIVETAGPNRVAMITDATAAAGLGDGTIRLGGLEVDVASGVARLRGTSTLAGSTATADMLFRGAAERLGRTDEALTAAVQMTSTTPANALGLEGVGNLRPGLAADLVVLDEDLQVRGVMAGGDWAVRLPNAL